VSCLTAAWTSAKHRCGRRKPLSPLPATALKVAEAERAQVEAQRREITWRRAQALTSRAPAERHRQPPQCSDRRQCIRAAEPMFRIIAKGEIELDGEVPETLAPRLDTAGRPGATIESAGAPRPFEGKLCGSSLPREHFRLGDPQPAASVLLFIVLMVLGTMSFMQLPVTRFPNIDIPIVSVVITDPGVAPSELETQVTKRVEDAVANVTGVKNVISTSPKAARPRLSSSALRLKRPPP
jgi:hypothetical protein